MAARFCCWINKRGELTFKSADGEQKETLHTKAAAGKNICIYGKSRSPLAKCLLALFPTCSSNLPAILLLFHSSLHLFIFPLCLLLLLQFPRVVFFLQQEENSARRIKKKYGAVNQTAGWSGGVFRGGKKLSANKSATNHCKMVYFN